MKKKICLFLGGVIALFLGVVLAENRGLFTKSEPRHYSQADTTAYRYGPDIFISPSELYGRLHEANLIILDGSHPRVYAKNHIPGAINIGFKGLSRCSGKPGDPNWGTLLDKEALTKKLESLGVDDDAFVVVYSDILKGPGACGRAVWQMKVAGLEKVRLLLGGLELWKRSGYELSKEVLRPIPATGLMLKEYDESLRASMAFVSETMGTLKILDVRSKKEFTGEDTSHGEARGGHIKGAQWLEWTDLLNEDSTPKSAEEITRLMAYMGITPADDFVLY